jgi:hypothetical protein
MELIALSQLKIKQVEIRIIIAKKTQTNSLFNTQNDNKQKEESIAINVIISSKKYSTLVLIQMHQIHYSMFQIS